VRNHWNGFLGIEILNPMDSLKKRLRILKGLVIKWERKKKLIARGELLKIEEELELLYSNNPGGIEKEEDKVIVIGLEKRKLILLRQEEETWRQKSRINSLAVGDRNTKFFHAYSTSRKQNNTIWEIRKEDGIVITSNQYLQLQVVEYFQNIYKAQSNLCTNDQLALLKNYPRMITEEDNHRVIDLVKAT
jgi:hypothetical protein